MRKIYFILLTFFIVVNTTVAQDPHWSMIQWNSLYLNPAMAGFSPYKNNITLFYRNQWRVAPVPFNTPMLSYHRNIWHSENGFRLGAGVQMLYDRTSDGNIHSFRPALALAAGKFFNDEKQNISIGMQLAYIRKQLNFSSLTFGSQFNGSEYDQGLATGELLAADHDGYLDVGIGLNFNTIIRKSGSLDMGFSANNLNKPNYQFLQNSETTVAARYMAYTKGDIPVSANRYWEINPAVFYQRQGKAQETVIQSLASVYIKGVDNPDAIKVSFGPGYRWNDAVIAYIGASYKGWKIGGAFDGNISDFKNTTNGRGAYEVMLTYQWGKTNKRQVQQIIKVEEKVEEEKVVADEVVEEQIPDQKILLDDAPTTPAVEAIKEEVSIPQPTPAPAAPTVSQPDYIQQIEKLSPVVLYFDNDKPKAMPATYPDLYQDYIQKSSIYTEKNGTQGKVFFEEIQQEYTAMQQLLPLIHTALKNGKHVEVTLRGYTSPAATNEYNMLLAEKRINAIKNMLLSWDNGVLGTYFTTKALILHTSAVGEVVENENTTSDPIYSINAAKARKAEVTVRVF